MTTTTQRPQRIDQPADALLAISRSLGFLPESSCVVVALNPAREVCLIARLDLAALDAPEHWSEGLLRAVRSAAPRGKVMLCVYADAGAEADAEAALDALTRIVAQAKTPILHRIIVSGSRFRIVKGDDAAAWHDLPERSHARRSDLVTELAPAADLDRNRVAELIAAAPRLSESGRDIAIAHALDVFGRSEPSLEEVALLLASLRDLRVRDTVLWDLMQAKPRLWRRAADSLARAVRLAPPEETAPAAALLSILRWQTGDGTRAVIALEKALEAEPAYSLALLVDAMLTGGLSPTFWREGLDGLSREACRQPLPRSAQGM